MSPLTFDLYGFPSTDLSAIKVTVEQALGVDLEEHESSYHCGNYFRYGSIGGEHLILQRNFDELEGEWTEEQFRNAGILLYVNETGRASEIREALIRCAPEVELLRHRELDA